MMRGAPSGMGGPRFLTGCPRWRIRFKRGVYGRDISKPCLELTGESLRQLRLGGQPSRERRQKPRPRVRSFPSSNLPPPPRAGVLPSP